MDTVSEFSSKDENGLTCSKNLELFEQAANLLKVDVNSFVFGSAVEKANKLLNKTEIVNKNENTTLNLWEQTALVEVLQRKNKPTPPNHKIFYNE